MAIEVTQIIGDTVELVFNPAEEDLHVGDNLSVRGRHEERSLIVQVIEIKAFFSTSLLLSGDQRSAVGPPRAAPALAKPQTRSPRRRNTPQPPPDNNRPYIAIAKIRRMTDPVWRPWDGWLPTNPVVVNKTADEEVLRQCIPDLGNPLRLGKTLADEPFHIEGAMLGALNLIAGMEGSATAHLAQVLMSRLIEHGHPCFVFDTRGVYGRLSLERARSSNHEAVHQPIARLMVGASLKLSMAQVSLDTLSAMLRQFGLPTAVSLYFISHVARRFPLLNDPQAMDQPATFLGIDDLIHLARNLETEGQPVAGGAILSCLGAIKQAQIFATQPHECTALHDGYAEIRHGGALAIDLSRLTRCARTSVVSALVSSLRDIAESERLACLFFDEAQSLVGRSFVTDVLLPMRHLGLRSFFVTTSAIGLGDHLEHDADNLFLCQVTSNAARHLAKHSRVDASTLQNVGRRLRPHHSLLVGKATGGYPIIFAMEPVDSIEITGAGANFSPVPAISPMHPGTRARPRFARRSSTPAELDPGLPLFPEETPPLTPLHQAADDTAMATRPPPSTPSLEHVTLMWNQVVKRVARRRRILETILAAARPLRVNEQGLVLSFPPQQRFQQELVESDEYRSLLEEELRKAFGVNLEVTTEVYPA